jgi:hypothetical protein
VRGAPSIEAASPSVLTESEAGRLSTRWGVEADSCSVACAGPQPPQDGKHSRSRCLKCAHVCDPKWTCHFFLHRPHSLFRVVIQPFSDQPIAQRGTRSHP